MAKRGPESHHPKRRRGKEHDPESDVLSPDMLAREAAARAARIGEPPSNLPTESVEAREPAIPTHRTRLKLTPGSERQAITRLTRPIEHAQVEQEEFEVADMRRRANEVIDGLKHYLHSQKVPASHISETWQEARLAPDHITADLAEYAKTK